MREFLLTKLICYRCGGNLTLTDDKPNCYRLDDYSDGEPTAAARVKQIVFVHPCKCTTQPIDDLRNAINALINKK